jgi:hypothetical protein
MVTGPAMRDRPVTAEDAAIPAVTVSLPSDAGNAALADMLAEIVARVALAGDVGALFSSALAELAERTKSGVSRHAAAVLRGRRSWSAMTPHSAARPCASSPSLATAVAHRVDSRQRAWQRP